MTNNTTPELPVETLEEIKKGAQSTLARASTDLKYSAGYYDGYSEGASAYATKLHQAEQENTELRRWKIEAAELLTKIHSYAHKHLEIKLGESIVDFVIARAKERDEFKSENDKLKQQATGWRPLLEDVLKYDEAFGELSIEMIDKIKRFLYGE